MIAVVMLLVVMATVGVVDVVLHIMCVCVVSILTIITRVVWVHCTTIITCFLLDDQCWCATFFLERAAQAATRA